MSVKIYDSTAEEFVDAGVPKIKLGGVWSDAVGKVWNGSEWVDAFGGSAVLTVGSIYTLDGTNTTVNQPIKAVCIQMDETNKTAVMQSYGFGHGTWPGERTFAASSYGTTVGNFNMSDIQLAKGTTINDLTACGISGQSSLIHTAFVDSATNYSSFGASYDKAWLGTPNTSSYAWFVRFNGNFNYDLSTYNYVVAPCFILDLSNVKLKDNILYAK